MKGGIDIARMAIDQLNPPNVHTGNEKGSVSRKFEGVGEIGGAAWRLGSEPSSVVSAVAMTSNLRSSMSWISRKII